MRSEARALLAEMTEEHGMDGVLRLATNERADLPPGSTEYPPCRCPQHRSEEPQESGPTTALNAKLRAVNDRSQGGRPRGDQPPPSVASQDRV